MAGSRILWLVFELPPSSPALDLGAAMDIYYLKTGSGSGNECKGLRENF